METDNTTEGLSVELTDKHKYTVRDYAQSSPKVLRNLFNFLENMSALADANYFVGETVSQKHLFDAHLILCDDLADSIKYMASIDPENYELPTYPGCNGDIRMVIDSLMFYKGDPTIFRYFDYPKSAFISVDYEIKKDGNLELIGVDLKDQLRRQLKDSLKSDEAIVNQIYNSVVQTFSKLKPCIPGMYNGKRVTVGAYFYLQSEYFRRPDDHY